jgi:C-terminal processing protease CtpA/Prc
MCASRRLARNSNPVINKKNRNYRRLQKERPQIKKKKNRQVNLTTSKPSKAAARRRTTTTSRAHIKPRTEHIAMASRNRIFMMVTLVA